MTNFTNNVLERDIEGADMTCWGRLFLVGKLCIPTPTICAVVIELNELWVFLRNRIDSKLKLSL